MNTHRRILSAALLIPLALGIAEPTGMAFNFWGSKPKPTPEQVEPKAPSQPSTEAPAYGGAASRKAQAEFLQRIRRVDPERKTIERAVFNQRNELGIILSRGVEMDTIPTLMKGLLTQMAKAFPGQDAVVLAYAPSTPPLLIGTAKLNAKTRVMTYERAKHR